LVNFGFQGTYKINAIFGQIDNIQKNVVSHASLRIERYFARETGEIGGTQMGFECRAEIPRRMGLT
jgi:hypothetical protein